MGPREQSNRVSRRQLLSTVVAGGVAALSGCVELLTGADDLFNDGPSVGLELIADGFTYLTDLVEIPDGSGRLLVTDQIGIVYSVDKSSGVVTEVADLTDRMVEMEGDFSERGLLGIACHPAFEENGRIFIRYSGHRHADDPGSGYHTEVLSEFHADGDSIDTSSEQEILRIPQPNVVHQGGKVLFGPDGYLYHTTGDGGGVNEGYDPTWYDENPGRGAHAQTTTDNLLGAVLRIDIDNDDDAPYSVPADNPLVDLDGHRDEYYAWGFRNPWGASFDGDDLYVADVGEARFETVNLVEKGGNYGWNVKEGAHCYDQDSLGPIAECPDSTPEDVRGGEPLLDPIIEYPQYQPTGSVDDNEFDTDTRYGSAIIGGFVHRGSVEALSGAYVFGDWSADAHASPAGELFLARPRDELEDVAEYFEEFDLWGIERLQIEGEGDVADDGDLQRYVCGMGADLDGETYVLTTQTAKVSGDTAEIRRIVPP